MMLKKGRTSHIGWESYGSGIIRAFFSVKRGELQWTSSSTMLSPLVTTKVAKISSMTYLSSLHRNVREETWTSSTHSSRQITPGVKTSWSDMSWKTKSRMARLENLRTVNNIVIGGTIFPHKRTYKATICFTGSHYRKQHR